MRRVVRSDPSPELPDALGFLTADADLRGRLAAQELRSVFQVQDPLKGAHVPHVGAKRTHFGVSFLFSFLSPVPADTPPFQAKALLLGLPPACSSSRPDCNATTGIASGLSSLPLVPAADCPPPCGHRSLCRKARASHRRQSIAAIKVQADCPPGAGGKTRQSKRHPPAGGCLVLFLGNFFSPAELFQVQAVFQNVAHSIEQSDAEQQ